MLKMSDGKALVYCSLDNIHGALERGMFRSFPAEWCAYQRDHVFDKTLHFGGAAALGDLLQRRYVGVVVYDIDRDTVLGHCIGILDIRTDGHFAFIELSRHLDQAIQRLSDRTMIHQQLAEMCSVSAANRIYTAAGCDAFPQVREWHSFFPPPRSLCAQMKPTLLY